MKEYIREIRDRGLSVRFTCLIAAIVFAAVATVLVYKTHIVMDVHEKLSVATDSYIALTTVAKDLMDASDYLTQEVQLYTVNRDTVHVNNYFKEANETRRRENAIKVMGNLAGDTEAFRQLQLAYNASMKLMEREYYAMKLVLVACNISEYPEELKDVELSDTDIELSGEKKLERAQEMVHDKFYYKQKTIIRNRMRSCIDDIEGGTHWVQTETDKLLAQELFKLRWVIIALTIVVLLVFGLTINLVIRPLYKGVKKIEADEPINVVGGREFRTLARTYNRMYETQKQSIEILSYEASHDALTGLYNRAGYDYIKNTIDLKSTAMILIDCDMFKSINDTMGHEIGDKILIKLAEALKNEFRPEDYVCRIGGDEFLIFMCNADKKCRNLIRDKIKNVNEKLHNTVDGLPYASISAGVVLGGSEKNLDIMFRHADLALYKMKEQRNGCAFYNKKN